MLAAALLLVPAQPAPGEEGARARDLGVYHTYDEMVSGLENLTAAHPDIMALESIGRTYEDRDLWVVKLSDNVSVDEAEPNITIFGGIHAGELISVEVALYILEFLVGNYSLNSTVGWYVNSTQIWFMPMVNPDGHVFAEQGNNWRKNRRPTGGGNIGVDLNRNFGHLWGLEASHNPAEDNYCGPYAFSENETRAVARLVTDHHPEITISYHSYAPYILYPWGNSIDTEPVDERLPQIAWNMSQAMPEGRRYAPIMALGMYPATGDTDDWFYANLSILPFTVEIGTSNRPVDSAVPGICADNLGPAMYVLNYTVGSPPPPPPRRSIALEGPSTFGCVPLQELRFDFTLENTGEAAENVSVGIESSPEGWAAQLSPGSVELPPGESVNVILWCTVPELIPAGTGASFSLRAASVSGANASARLDGRVGTGRAVSIVWGNPGTLAPGQSASIPFTVRNNGNAFDNISLSASADTGWAVSQVASPFGLAPWTATNTFVRLQVPERLPPGVTRVNLTLECRNGDGDVRLNSTCLLSVETLLRLEWSVAPSSVVLYEGSKEEVSITLVNAGNVRERGNLTLGGDSRYASLDRKAVDLPPGESAMYVLTIQGKPGRWRVNISLASADGYPPRQIGVDCTIKARPEAPRNTLQDAIIVMDIVFIAIVIGYIVYRVKRKRRKGRVPP